MILINLPTYQLPRPHQKKRDFILVLSMLRGWDIVGTVMNGKYINY